MSGYEYFMDYPESPFVWRYREGEEYGEVAYREDLGEFLRPFWDPALATRRMWRPDRKVDESELPEWVIR